MKDKVACNSSATDESKLNPLVSIEPIYTISDLKHLSQENNLESNFQNEKKEIKKDKPNDYKLSNISTSTDEIEQNENFWQDNDTIDMLPKVMSFTWFDILLNLFSIFCYMLDVVSDIVTSYVHYYTKNWIFFNLTVIFIVIPALITTLISLRWYIIDSKSSGSPPVSKKRWLIRSIFLFFQMGQIMRYIDSLSFGIKYMNNPNVKFYQYMVHEDTDATMLRLFECFMESAPQLLIQLYLIVVLPFNLSELTSTNILFYVVFPYFSCCISLFSIALALVSYYKSLRMALPDKINLTMFEMGVQVLWRLLMLASRILALTLFITVFSYYIITVLSAHWAIMFIWILSMKTRFCENKIEEIIYDALIAIMFIFCYFNPIDNDTRFRYLLFYAIMFFENSILLYFWYFNAEIQEQFKQLLVISYYVFFFMGILVMVYYYLFCHPTKSIKIFRTREQIEKNNMRYILENRDEQRKNFNTKDWITESQLKNLIDNLNKKYGIDEVESRTIGKVKKKAQFNLTSNA